MSTNHLLDETLLCTDNFHFNTRQLILHDAEFIDYASHFNSLWRFRYI